MMTEENFDADFSPADTWAAMYRAHGFQVVPAYTPREDPINWKRPKLPVWTDLALEIVPELTFERWYGEAGEHRQRMNMGMVTGTASARAFVIDLDSHKNPNCLVWWAALLAVHNSNMALPTPTQTTGGGGKQMILRAPEWWAPPTCKTSLGVDIRGQGGFAMLPPSLHVSGRPYRWDAGSEPWAIEVADAPDWLCEAIDALVIENGGSVGGSARERTASGETVTAFGRDVDMREQKMTDWVWARLVDLRRESPILSPLHLEQEFEDLWQAYERSTASRLTGPGTNADLLEREGRGKSALRLRWDRALKKWDADLKTAAATPKAETTTEPPVPFVDKRPIRTFDFATLYLENVVEEPDYIEPDLLGHGGFLLLAGPPKAQKSFLLQDMLVNLATGRDFLGFKVPRPLRVFYLQAEMNLKLLRRRAKILKDLTPVQIDMLAANLVISDRFRMVLNEGGVQVAAKLILESFGGELPDIIAMDPLANLFDQENESDNTQIMKFLTQRVEPVRQLVNPLAGLIMAHHVTKKSAEEIASDPFVTIRGGGALRGYYDSAMVLYRKVQGQPERGLHFEMRGGEAPEPKTVVMVDGRFVEAEDKPVVSVLSGLDTEFVLREVDARWQRREPFAIGSQGRRLTLEMWLMQARGLKRFEAKILVEQLIASEAIKSAVFDAKSKAAGWRRCG